MRKGTFPDDRLRKISEYLNVSADFLSTGIEPKNDKFSTEQAKLVGKIRKDEALAKALEKYFNLSDEKKKHVIDTINMLSEEK